MLTSLTIAVTLLTAAPGDYFQIQVVDADSGRGVPLVELKTVNHLRFYTDSNGLVAFHEPGLMGQRVFFHVRSHGYEFPKDGFGYRGRRLQVKAGGKAILRIKRLNVAERLYRVTGAGIYRDTILLGQKPPLTQPVLNGLVFGSDSVVNAVFKNRIYWFWGDTNRPSYPLGNFHVPGATSKLPQHGGLDPDRGIELSYFTDANGFAKPTCRMPGKGPTWIGGLTTIKEKGQERLFATYVKVQPPLRVYERGLVEFDDATKEFQHRRRFKLNSPFLLSGHPFHHRVGPTEYIYFGGQFPLLRVPATAQAIADPAQYEAYTYLRTGSQAEDRQVERDGQGQLRWAWRKGTIPPNARLEKQLIGAGKLKQDEAYFQVRDIESGKRVTIHSSSVAWNPFHKCWVMIALQSFGTSALGEVWIAAAKQPQGPWKTARKIVAHEKYSFYNPKQHAMLAKQGGRLIYFEATYTTLFSGNQDATPRYNYNQLMYRVNLADPRLAKLFQP